MSIRFYHLVRRAQEFEPWWFKFEKDGIAFGGTVDRDTAKTGTLFDWMSRLGLPLHTVLELGSHEGSHSLQLASHPGVEKVIAIEGRADNFARGQFVKSVFGQSNIEQHHANLESFDPAEWPAVDAVFCAGLLYHLPRPWEMINKIGRIAKYGLFLDTHYAASEEVVMDGRGGYWFREGEDSLSGLSERSFWLTFKSLTIELMNNGFILRHIIDLDTPNGPRVQLFAEARK